MGLDAKNRMNHIRNSSIRREGQSDPPGLPSLKSASGLSTMCKCNEAPRQDFGAEISVWADFALSRRGQAIRRETGMPRPVMMLMTLQATLASVFCAGRLRA
jgi:hypothetical protein